MGVLGRVLGGEVREDFRRRVDQLLEITQKMLETDKEHIKALREHREALVALRLTLKELKESL
jgi:hypothetical protein